MADVSFDEQLLLEAALYEPLVATTDVQLNVRRD
jgi:hypothetical protein